MHRWRLTVVHPIKQLKENRERDNDIRKISKKSLKLEPGKSMVGVLSFEVVNLMTRVVKIWQCLNDKQIVRLRDEIVKSLGIQKLVSDDDRYVMDLVLAEIIENMLYVANSVARFGNKCVDPVYHRLEHVFDDPVEIDLNWSGWEYNPKKMERRVKKMQRFIAATSQLYQELEVMADLEQTMKRMQRSVDSNQVQLLEFQQKVMWQRQEVKNLRDMSLWGRTHDYTVRLLLRSLFTVVKRINCVFGNDSELGSVEESYSFVDVDADCLLRSQSFSAYMQYSVRPSETKVSKFYSGPLVRSISNLGMSAKKSRTSGKQQKARHQPSTSCGKPPLSKTRRLANFGQLKGCLTGGTEDSPPSKSDFGKMEDDDNAVLSKISSPNSKHKLLNAIPSTLGNAALALHYANVIILVEKLASSPHLISLDARDDLYNMLPSDVRNSLRSNLRIFAKSLATSIYDIDLAAEWNLALTRILNWLGPLAHNTIKWHSERNFEKQHIVTGSNVLLVQTLYFANKEKTEAAITELLVGLNYLSRFGREPESACS